MTYAAITHATIKEVDANRPSPTICFHFYTHQTPETASQFAADLAAMGYAVSCAYKSHAGLNALNVAFEPGTDLKTVIGHLMPRARQGSLYEYTA